MTRAEAIRAARKLPRMTDAQVAGQLREIELREVFRAQLTRLQQAFGKRPPNEIGGRTHATGRLGSPRWEPNGTVPWGQD